MKNNNHDRIINDLKAKYGDKIDTVKFDIPLMIQKYKKGGGICPVGMSVQSLIFPKENYTKAQAKSWAKKHQYKNRVDEKENTYRMRQVLPTRFKLNSFRTIELKNTKGIKAVIGCPKSK
jgi:hypothetical protein